MASDRLSSVVTQNKNKEFRKQKIRWPESVAQGLPARWLSSFTNAPSGDPANALTNLEVLMKIWIPIVLLLAGIGPALAETIDVSDSHGGVVSEYNARWAELGARGVNVRIVGPCQSACTVLLAHIPRERICVTPGASFGFHLAKTQTGTSLLRAAYSSDIMGWIDAHGGLQPSFIWMRAPDTYKFFKRC